MPREDIEFSADNVTLRGWFYPAEGVDTRAPVIVMVHGLSAVKEMYLDEYAESFSRAGLNVLVYDHRNFGASDGAPRQHIDSIVQARDLRHAITYATEREDVDPDRVGIWGSSHGGGLVLSVAAVDRRVRAVVAQVPFISGSGQLKRLVRPDFLPTVRTQLDSERRNIFHGGEPTLMPAVAADPLAPALMSSAESWEFFTTAAQDRAPSWRNEVTLSSLERIIEFEPGDGIHRISPSPLLMIVADQDISAYAELAFEAYERALEPKQLVVLSCGHFDVYTGSAFETSSKAAREHFVRALA
ncbi:alpha/beta hydrolase [Antrihabitans stalactiti]|uniref:Alpha/beta hydrolase n=1 Tax=Antrihabitans stalactiti TaxID=2584121 RepID=A0A848KKK0_9NOCA|nr:alpha/beta fold hydrolase [Antrihabitans stalactiti]NMN98386.1 alpha/beta hydrolase [Antrihabitans stalactiti]